LSGSVTGWSSRASGIDAVDDELPPLPHAARNDPLMPASAATPADRWTNSLRDMPFATLTSPFARPVLGLHQSG